MKSGKWQKKLFGKARGLKGRTLGIIGLGNIGKEVVTRAKGLETNVIVWSRSLTPERAREFKIDFANSPLTQKSALKLVNILLTVFRKFSEEYEECVDEKVVF